MSAAAIYAVGDIHGHLDQLTRALDQIETDGGPDAQVVFLGDLVDRGAESAQVIDLLSDGIAQGRNWTVLRGNHDVMFLNFLQEGRIEDARVMSGRSWLHPNFGGLETLGSYGMSLSEMDLPIGALWRAALERVPYRHLKFLMSLPFSYQTDSLFFAHAGIRPGLALDDQAPDDLSWIRAEFLDDPRPHPKLVVHGHSAVNVAEHRGNRVNLDSGAGFGRPITAAVFETGQVWTLGPFGRQPLRPSPPEDT